jgi:hypothetical protein
MLLVDDLCEFQWSGDEPEWPTNGMSDFISGKAKASSEIHGPVRVRLGLANSLRLGPKASVLLSKRTRTSSMFSAASGR